MLFDFYLLSADMNGRIVEAVLGSFLQGDSAGGQPPGPAWQGNFTIQLFSIFLEFSSCSPAAHILLILARVYLTEPFKGNTNVCFILQIGSSYFKDFLDL